MLSQIEELDGCLSSFTHLKDYDGMIGLMPVDDNADALIGCEVEFYGKKHGKAAEAFVSGRRCVRALQKQLNLQEFELPSGEFGPIWPSGLAGSISHSVELVAVTILRDVLSVGVDIEKQGRLKVGAIRRVATQGERERYSSVPDFDWTLLFSAKESVFKAVSPLARRHIGFRELEVVFDPIRQSFAISYSGNRINKALFKKSRGYWTKFAGHFITLATVK